MQVFEVTAVIDAKPTYRMLDWALGVPGTNAGDLKMVTEWPRLPFVILNPYMKRAAAEQPTTMSRWKNTLVWNAQRRTHEPGKSVCREMGLSQSLTIRINTVFDRP